LRETRHTENVRRAKIALAVAAAAVTALSTQAVLAAPMHRPGPSVFAVGAANEVSTNWAGYAVSSTTRGRRFTSVTGRWVQPAATCDSGQTYSAFWVGLGGFSRSAFAVEQTGTQANCEFGRPVYVAWFELFPAAPVNLRMSVRPGDLVSATVTVNRTVVLVRLKNVTLNKLFTKRLRMKRADLSSAEWIAEAPTGCDYLGNCTTLPLTNFGTVDFTHATTAVAGHRGRISDTRWNATAIELHGDLADPVHPTQAGANALPGALGGDGGSFQVSWQDLTPPPPPPPPPPGG
jgi:hypothetical protein